jgi:hypothetical protein
VSSIPVAGEEPIVPLPVGIRVRDPRHPELEGRIEGYEWNQPGVLSAIPYRIAWDSSDRACDIRGWFYYWATPDGIEKIETKSNFDKEPKPESA